MNINGTEFTLAKSDIAMKAYGKGKDEHTQKLLSLVENFRTAFNKFIKGIIPGDIDGNGIIGITSISGKDANAKLVEAVSGLHSVEGSYGMPSGEAIIRTLLIEAGYRDNYNFTRFNFTFYIDPGKPSVEQVEEN